MYTSHNELIQIVPDASQHFQATVVDVFTVTLVRTNSLLGKPDHLALRSPLSTLHHPHCVGNTPARRDAE